MYIMRTNNNIIPIVTEYCGGWAAFVISIMFVGIITTMIGDFASGFGCSIGLKDVTTAITFVALGTSLPGLPFTWW